MRPPLDDDDAVNSTPTNNRPAAGEASAHDSLVTVRLSESPSPTLDAAVPSSTAGLSQKPPIPEIVPDKSASPETFQGAEDDDDDDSESEIFEPETSKRRKNLLQELGKASDGRKRSDSASSSDSEHVDWDALQKKEDLEAKEHGARIGGRANDLNPTAASLLAKLNQENARIAAAATNPRTAAIQSSASKPRPPSMAQLRKMISGPTPPALRYSTLPPTPMTELDFYLALVKDPKQTAARLPTLLSNKVRKGIPPPLRGVVWQSMAGARDSALEELYDRLSGETSPYEGMISKDLGRSFPGVDMFRDPDGEGQKMLARVLKCFSLYDKKIGYCQGLAFLVGPLLMHMQDKQAFCVLVKLMENYEMRHCFVPDLSGLHLRIYQFRELLRQHLPTLSAHLDQLGVDHAYVSQWFLSFYAVTCPLPMLFRIYDVIFAEGASETIMRVALSLMRKNQVRILGCTELEDVMHLLLSRGVWDCYGHNADDFVNDFVALADIVTRDRLAALEQGYKEQTAKISSANANQPRPGAPQAAADVTTVASRFLGRLWASSLSSPSPTPKVATFAAAATQTSTTSASVSAAAVSSSALSPTTASSGSIVSRPLSMLRRSTSKQSLSSMEAASSSTASSAASVFSSASIDTTTTISRDSTPDDPPTPNPAKTPAAPAAAAAVVGPAHAGSAKDGSKYLHTQIEDLLTALSELQRNHAILASQLQREKEEREEDRRAVRALLDGLRGDENTATAPSSSADLSGLIEAVQVRFGSATDDDTSNAADASPRSSSMAETKQLLRDELARAREQLVEERERSKELRRRIQDITQEAASLRDQLRESHAHVRNVHQEKQRLERQIQGMRLRASDTPSGGAGGASEWFPRALALGGGTQASTTTTSSTSGLRELKLARSRSTPSHAQGPTGSSSLAINLAPQKRSSTLPVTKRDTVTASQQQQEQQKPQPTSEQDALLLELVQAKTAEAVARQELEECKQKLEQLRKAIGLAPGENLPPPGAAAAAGGGGASSAVASAAAAVGRSMFGRSVSTSSVSTVATTGSGTTLPASTGGGGGGFWGWRR
ncbi:hypothetical protein VTJ04DRAFT_5493 [Mycothermus thermophilus]|uniref:uncharacterized protein n=1 Tax=Humicola insolens TaxID=85995 RepID=UPI0037424E9F